MRDSSVVAVSARPRRNLVGPLLLVGIGVLLLLNNLGVVPWSIWTALWPYWPLLIILLGIEALLTGRLSWGWLVLTIVLVGIGSVGVNALAAFGSQTDLGAPIGPPARQLRQELGGAGRAQVRLSFGGGTLRIGPLDDPGMLAEANQYGSTPSFEIEREYRVRDGIGDLRISAGGGRFMGPPGETRRDSVEVQLSREVPLDLQLEAGAAELAVDLRDLQVADLRIETGASRGTITLPAAGQTRARIEGGVTALKIVVPSGVEARIVVDGGLSDIRVDESRFPPQGRQSREYRSGDYDTAPNRVDLRISVGAARLDVQ